MGASARRRRAARREAKKDPESKGGSGFTSRVSKPLLRMEAGHMLVHKSWREMLWMLAMVVAVWCLYRAITHHAEWAAPTVVGAGDETREDAPLILRYRSSRIDIDSGDDRYDFQSD